MYLGAVWLEREVYLEYHVTGNFVIFLRPVISAQLFLVSLCLSTSECSDGSLYSMLLLHASHAAHQDQIKTPQIYVCYVWYVCKGATGRQSNCSK